MMSRYEILLAIFKRQPATLESLYDEMPDVDKDGYSLIDELDFLVSQGLVEEHQESAGTITYVLTALGKKELDSLREPNY